MRTPEHRAPSRAGKNFEVDMNMHYLAPGAFTVLPTDAARLPDPPPAPVPYRLTPSTHRHKHQSFAIIGEVSPSNPNSRSSSPTGRVSPFKGHGFNPTGSRHASPIGSPVPPEDPRSTSPNPNGTRSSKTGATRTRKNSNSGVFGEKVSHLPPRKFNRQLSQSLTNLESKNVPKRLPPSPRKRVRGFHAFQELSPILGSSPEPSQSLSSPSRIPIKSKSTPPSRIHSPTRNGSKPPSRSQSRSNLGYNKDSGVSPRKLPLNRYEHIQSKINTFHKPKLSPKPPLSSSDENESPQKRIPPRRNSINRTSSRPNLLPKTYMGNKNQNYVSDSSVSNEQTNSSKSKTTSSKSVGLKVNSKSNANISGSVGKPALNSNTKASLNNSLTKPNNSVSINNNKKDKDEVQPISSSSNINEKGNNNKKENEKTSSVRGSKTDLQDVVISEIPASTAAVVSGTTTTVTKPLKIDTPTFERAKAVSPMIDGRVLSATSVSNAINKMNDTVLNTKTLIKDSGLNNRISSISNDLTSNLNKPANAENNNSVHTDNGNGEKKQHVVGQVGNKIIDSSTKNIATVPNGNNKKASNSSSEVITDRLLTENNIKTSDSNHQPLSVSNNHTNNHVATIGLGNAKAIEMEVQNNMNKLIGSMDSSLGDLSMAKFGKNDRNREAKALIEDDAKPIKITVREKPSDLDVQSGNVGPHYGISNGVSERPGLPPAQPSTPPNEPAKQDPPPNRCKRILHSCSKVLTCNRCRSCKRVPKVVKSNEEVHTTGCFKCLKKSKKEPKREQIRINVEDESEQTKAKFWNKLNCCKKNRVGDTQSCFPIGKRKESWVERSAGSFLESEVQPNRTKCCSKDGCKNFWRKIFCCCCKKKEEVPIPATRKESMVSSKKKSLTPTSMPPPEDTKPKIDASLVEHTSHMKGAIPVLPVWLAWFCCFMNCIGPGTGTVLSGLFCLCIGKPRFSQKDGPKPRIGAFIIDIIIGFSQFFTVLFCLVGWGWSIWWGVIMVKVAKKHKKFKQLEKFEEQTSRPALLAGDRKRDAERGKK
ncbi:protein stum isoform X2 [Sitophilus oryzae]|uniref:Protein stum isoform X2 n=1 Tax=Sitophilus oryzae TaxID=7048 RepID=A0A6J2Y098_SITOR|nr:protein stum isoform X2 [Sitophilus oryzae]